MTDARLELLRVFGERSSPRCTRCRKEEGAAWCDALWVCLDCADALDAMAAE